MKNALLRWLKIYEEEASLFFWSAFLLFSINVAQILLNNYAETAFLKRFGVEYLFRRLWPPRYRQNLSIGFIRRDSDAGL